jgi:hypothetical protein
MGRDPRSEELENLRLALGTFALQLDAFEVRIKNLLPLKTKVKAIDRAPPDVLANKIVSAMKERRSNNLF